jgi:zeaxanthin glucosyltransferase
VASIAIACLPEHGHVIPTLQLARELRAAGHRVVYVGLEDTRALVRDFGFVACCGDDLPLGTIAAARARAGVAPRALSRTLEQAWRPVAAASLLLGRGAAAIAALDVDLAICDRDWEDVGCAFRAAGVPVVAFTANLGGSYPSARLRDYWFDRDVPPMSSTASPDHPLALALAWARHAASEAAATLLREAFARSRDRAAIAARRRELRCHTPVLVLCPEELDFPGRRLVPGTHYIGPCIAADRGGAISLPDDRPIAFCTMGTHDHRVRGAFVQAIVDATRDWRLVIAADLAEPPPHVTARRDLPQLQVLARAAVAIVHGGLGTIKECIWSGVPMLVLPADHDQPGNAARVAYHGLGVVRARRRLGDVAAALDELAGRRALLARWSARFVACQREQRGVAVVDQLLRSARPAARS